MPDLVAGHLGFVCCSSLVKTLLEDVRHAEKLQRVPLSQQISARSNGSDSPASLSSGGAYDIVCCAVVGLILPGLEAGSHLSASTQCTRSK